MYPPFPFISHQLGYSGESSRVRLHLPVVPNFFCFRQSYGGCWVHLFLSFVFLPTLSYRCHSPAGFLPVLLSVLPDCISLHAAFLFLLSIRLVHSRLGALNAFLAIRLLGYVLLFGFFSSFDSFSFRFFYRRFRTFLSLLVCAFCVPFLLSRISGVEFLFPFLFVFVGLASDFLSSGFGMILDFCFALLPASISFPFVPARRPFLVLFLIFGCRCLLFLSGGFLLGFPGVCSLFSYPVRSLRHRLFGLSSVISLSLPLLAAFAEAGSCAFRFPFLGFVVPLRVPLRSFPVPA